MNNVTKKEKESGEDESEKDEKEDVNGLIDIDRKVFPNNQG